MRFDLRTRVTVGALAAVGAGLVILSVAINLLLAARLDADASSVLVDRADAALATLTLTGGRLLVSESASEGVLDRQSWVFAKGRVVERPTAPQQLQRAAAALANASRATERDAGGNIRMRAQPAFDRSGRRIGTVVVGVSLVPYEHSERIALVGTILLDLFVLVASGFLARRAVGAALRPVADMTRRVADWTATDLHRRFDVGPPRDELTALAATFDELLERIDAALRHEQRLTAEVAHELRTPLSGVRAEAELALGPGRSSDELRVALEHVLAGTDRMAAAIQTLLTTARISTAGTPGSSELAGAVSAVVAALRPAADAHGIAIDLSRTDGHLSVGASADVVSQALQPLIDNAVRHATSRVTVTIAEEAAGAVVRVLDDGAGLAVEDAEQVFEAGVSTTGSAGLGLPLARRLARSCGGDVVGVASTAGGCFELRLPSTAAQRSGNVQIA